MDPRHRPKMKIGPLTKNLWFEMSGGQWPVDHPDLWKRLGGGDLFAYEEVVEVRDALDTCIVGIEAIKGGGSSSFEEARDLNAALKSGHALLSKLDAYLRSNQ